MSSLRNWGRRQKLVLHRFRPLGVMLSAALEHICAKNGVPFDIGQLKPENLEDLISHLDELTVDVDAQDAKVRIYCE